MADDESASLDSLLKLEKTLVEWSEPFFKCNWKVGVSKRLHEQYVALCALHGYTPKLAGYHITEKL